MTRLAVLTKEFGDILKLHHKEHFESSTFEATQAELAAIQSQQDQTKTMMNMNRISIFLTAMDELEKALTKANFPDAGQAIAYVWGSIRFLLKTSYSDPTARAFNDVLNVYQQLGVHIPSLSKHRRLFQESTDATECLLNIYQDVQRFHRLAYKLFSLRQSLWKQLHKSIWTDLSHTFKELAMSLDAHRNFIEKWDFQFQNSHLRTDISHHHVSTGLGLHNPEDWSHFTEHLNRYRHNVEVKWREFERREAERRREQRAKINTWISDNNRIQEIHKRFQQIRTCPRSGRWLFTSYSQVSHWIKEDDPPESALWLHGSKGFGKTILSSLLIYELQSLNTQEKGYVIPADSKTYYFYCQEDDNEHRTYLDILKGILHQMVDSNDYILPLCEDRISQAGWGSPANTGIAQTLIEAFVEHNSRQYIIIDGLDECEIADVRQTVKYFMGQVAKCDNNIKQGQLRVFFMSQPMPEMKNDMPEGDASIPLKLKDNADDIRAYVHSRIPEFLESGDSRGGFNLSATDKEQMESTICHQSEGKLLLHLNSIGCNAKLTSPDMFLYAHLTIEYLLQQQTKGDLLTKIKQEMLPDKLADIYEKLLGSIKAKLKKLAEGDAQWEKAKILLGWLVCAKRPLKWHEVQSILSFDPDSNTIDFDNRMLRHDVRKYLGSLVHVLDGGHIRLIHSTARWHIVHNHHISEKEVQCKLAALCLKYLSLPCFISGYQDPERIENARQGWFSFQDYACSHWHSHVDTVIKKCYDPVDLSLLEGFLVALDVFIKTHHQHLTNKTHAELEQDHVDKFQGLHFYNNLLVIWNHIFTHQKGSFDHRNKVGIAQIDEALGKNRAALEKNFSPSHCAIHGDTIEDYYGPNLFKCEKTLCRFFHVGYNSEKERKNHHNRHNRPYPCPVECNSAPIGFSNLKDKERHVRIYHPELFDGPSAFEAPRRGQGNFTCSICQQSFTRKINLRGHERSHFGDRPYKCPTCEKPFARVSDCRRHEKIHAKKGEGTSRRRRK